MVKSRLIDSENLLFLNGNESDTSYLAFGVCKELVLLDTDQGFQRIQQFLDENQNEYVFGYLSYELKDDVEQQLSSTNRDTIDAPVVYLFIPENLATINGDDVKVIKGDQQSIEQLLNNLETEQELKFIDNSKLKSSLDKNQYLAKVQTVKEHIKRGDIYEANFCYSVESENCDINPLGTYQRLNKITNAPFSAYGKLNDVSIISASPERFIRKTGNEVISQPIKGTVGRGESIEEDEKNIEYLKSNQKDRSENVMIVDLVRNDLSRIANPKSVEVPELCKIYSFKNIHQMISTVKAKVSEETTNTEILKALFPMGSMTGAPKVSAMNIIDSLEESKRGIYSGCIGYFAPNGDFDFNVVIRTILYNEKQRKLSFSVGGAITDLSDPEEEYEETLLKANALIKSLTGL